MLDFRARQWWSWPWVEMSGQIPVHTATRFTASGRAPDEALQEDSSPFPPDPSEIHTAPDLHLTGHTRPFPLHRRAPRPGQVPGCEPQAPQFPGPCPDSPPLAGPGCARAPWLPAGAPKPSSFSMPAISLSCWARKAAAGSSSAASGAPLSDDEKKPKSSAIFPASLLERPPGARLCPARARRCARRPRRCHPSRPGSRPRLGRARRGGPTLPLRHRAWLACHCSCRREEPGRECGDVTGRGRGPAARPEVASQRPQEGGSRTAARPRGAGGRAALCQDTRTRPRARRVHRQADRAKWPDANSSDSQFV